ncbi:hypothetical protein ACQ5SO_07005 [Rhodovulum sp. DZ06]|uniref:hypothetical protein n=1 Tax=Rhodovulum sp. DZ06 TaxID=3425126 RepID=UPI003D342C1C
MSRPGVPRPSPPGLAGVAERLATLAAVTLAVLAALLVQMAPLGLAPGAWPAPDLVFCALAWTATARPDALPVPAVFGFALLRDFAVGGATGAEALALALSIEALKAQARFQDRPAPMSDLAAAALAAAATLLVPWLLLKLSFAGTPPLSALAPRWLATMAALPVVAALMRYGLRIRRPAAADDDARRRLL